MNRTNFRAWWEHWYRFFYQKKMNVPLFRKLSPEIIRIILTYAGVLSDHNGKYMNRIDDNDPRYRISQTIPQPSIKYYPSSYDGRTYMCYEVRVNFSNRDFMVICNQLENPFGYIRYLYYWRNKDINRYGHLPTRIIFGWNRL